LKPEVKSGEAVAIVGIGGLGQLGLQFAKAMGYRTVAIDNRPEGRHLATDLPQSLRPDLVLDSAAADVSDKILDFTAGEGLGGIVVCTDSIEANAWSLQQLGNGGVMVPVGLPRDRWQFDSGAMVFRELTVRGVYVSGTQDVEEMLKVVAEHEVFSHITIMSFDDIPSIVKRYSDKSMKGRLVVQIVE
jgi:D-arabinose 1-dehydrogenase-like Zn-dependent alcohol dehydrogenase